MLKLLKYLKPYFFQCVLLIVFLCLQIWCSLQLPTIMADIVNNGITKGDSTYTINAGLHMLGFTLVAVFASIVTHFFSSRVGAAFSRDLRADFYKKVLSLSVSDIDNFSTASLITRTTNDISQVQSAVMMMLTMMLRAPLMGIGAIFQAFRVAPDMTWIMALAVSSVIFFSIIILGLVIPKFKIFQTLIDKITLIARENLTGLRVVRAFNNETREKEKFERANDHLTKTIIFINKIFALQDPLISFIFNGTSLLVVWIGISRLETNISYLGNMMAFLEYSASVIISFLILTMLFVVLPRANVSAARINEVLKTSPKIKWKPETLGEPEKIPSVEFSHVDFSYPDAEQKVLDNISFKAEAGKTTAFIGSTGSGKSTLISLVPRFYDPTSGKILINNLEIKNYSELDLMRRIGYVPQRGILFSGDINSNIKFGNESAPKNLVEKAAQISQSSEFIEKQEKKFSSHIAQGGSNVSGGQKQRLSIARAVAKSPEIYIFDDSFSALDMKTDKKLREALKKETESSVVLIVAQRVSTIKSADQIIVLDKGKIVGKGTHLDLLKTCKTYQQIVKSQMSENEYKKELSYAR
ncbi:ABC transporter ATP-binding protein [Candidatus Saccharibacteria bacterium]|nr:ABC transporter ATP-binding protein [Candidatus Saccharibacteria bacterium]